VDGQGHRFAQDYHPDGELAPRDVVSRAIFDHLQKTGDRQVWLDMRVIDTDRLQHRFPNILQLCRQWGCDPLEQPVPVAPAAHYWMGGITADRHSQTSIPGLYAVGENASTGVHGANRLASNSLLECLVYGAELAHLPLQPGADIAPTMPPGGPAPALELTALDAGAIAEKRQQLTQLMWTYAGISRQQGGLETAIAQLQDWRHQWQQHPLQGYLAALTPGYGRDLGPIDLEALRAWGELGNLYDIGWLVLNSAAFRTESRGGHFRADYPQPDPAWRVHSLVTAGQWSTSAPIARHAPSCP
jgi:L-aspartate oxidase